MDKEDLIFWTGIMSDHAQFQINAFSAKEDSYIKEAMMYHSVFEKYNMAVQSTVSTELLSSLKDTVIKFINFKRKIIAELLRCNILINFSPSFINHMVNEASEFLSLFNGDTCPPKTQMPATYIKLWIADASGHTSSIIASLDASETLLLENVQYYKSKFDNLYKKSVESEMIQENLCDYKDFNLLKTEAIDTLKQFIEFCKKLESLLDNCSVMTTGTFNKVIVNHFIKEHEYVIGKLLKCV